MSFPTEGPGDCPTPTVTHAHPGPRAPHPPPPPAGSLLSRPPIRPHPPRLLSPRHLFGKERAPGTVSHTRPGVLPNSQGRVSTRWPPAICRRSVGTAAAALASGWPRRRASRPNGASLAPQIRGVHPGAGRARLPAPRTVARLCPPGSLGGIQAPSPAEAGGVSCRWPSGSLCHLPAALASVSPPVE